MSDNAPMEKGLIRQILANNLRQAMAKDSNIDTQEKLAAKSGLSQSHISRLLLCEASATIDALVCLGKAVRCLPFELIADEESTRRAAIERMLGRDPAADNGNVVAIRRKKREP